jgi:hypothetical protein
MTRDELRSLLNSQTDSEFVEHEILNRRPWIFDTDEAYRSWRVIVSSELGLGPDHVRIVGSAATGFSLSPLKPGRPFRQLPGVQGQTSDIDIALIDTNLFATAWDIIVSFDRARRLGLSEDARAKVRLDVYWGLVGQYSLPPNTDPARRVRTVRAAAGRMPPLRGYPIRCRVYRRVEDLLAYHTDSLRQLRRELTAYGD